ncbi:MAG: HNH endonuclease [Bdellovibrionia bacterium]
MQSLKNISQTSLPLKGPSPESLSNEALLRNTRTLVAEERKLTTEILWHLHEIQIRKLYAGKGYASLFEYAVRELGYSEAAAGRRIAAMRLLIEVPEIEPALKNGSVSLSTLSTIQNFIQRKEEPVARHEKKELVFALQGKSRRECERELAMLDPVAALPKERERVVGATQTEIRFVADDELMEKLKRIRELDAHISAGASYLDLFHRMADIALKKLDPLAKDAHGSASRRASVEGKPDSGMTKSRNVTPPAESNHIEPGLSRDRTRVTDGPQVGNPGKNPRFIPAALKRAVWRRDKSQCSFMSSDGRRCSSRYGLQIDHQVPVALGGVATYDNLRLLCRAHNQYEAVIKLGPAVYS